nr:ATP-binding protein [Paenibacillus cellulositrophicus]
MSKNKQNSGRMPSSKGMDVASVYTVPECECKTKHIVFSKDNRLMIEEFIRIRDMKDKFAEHDVPMSNKLMMFGPPGTGKTLTAFYLAGRLGLPLIVVRLDTIINAHLGETGSNVRKIFEFAKSVPCILFVDEFDALARTRDTNDEVKEMARVVNTLLQCIDEFQGDSILMAATNLENELDHAIWRRFDTKLVYEAPDESSRLEYIDLIIGSFIKEDGIQERATRMLAGCSYADIEQILLKAKRKAIVDDLVLTQQLIESSIQEYRPVHLRIEDQV